MPRVLPPVLKLLLPTRDFGPIALYIPPGGPSRWSHWGGEPVTNIVLRYIDYEPNRRNLGTSYDVYFHPPGYYESLPSFRYNLMHGLPHVAHGDSRVEFVWQPAVEELLVLLDELDEVMGVR